MITRDIQTVIEQKLSSFLGGIEEGGWFKILDRQLSLSNQLQNY